MNPFERIGRNREAPGAARKLAQAFVCVHAYGRPDGDSAEQLWAILRYVHRAQGAHLSGWPDGWCFADILGTKGAEALDDNETFLAVQTLAEEYLSV